MPVVDPQYLEEQLEKQETRGWKRKPKKKKEAGNGSSEDNAESSR
jgi:hypothetical protein